MTAALPILLALIGQIAPLLGGSQISGVIKSLTDALPHLVRFGEAAMQPIRNIIAALRSNAEITPQQLADLAALEKMADASFEQSAQAAEAEDAAAAAKGE
jgi:hypothetical protein